MKAFRTLCLFAMGLLIGSQVCAQVIKDTKGGDETYISSLDSPFIKTTEFSSAVVGLNSNRAAYSNIRRFLNMDVMVPFAAVRIEEMLNYFNVNYNAPQENGLVDLHHFRSACPWNNEKELLYVQVNTAKIDLSAVPPSNLVFLIDVSGSMDLPNRLPLLKASFKKLVQYLRDTDTLSIVIYGGATGIYLNPTSGIEKEKIYKAIDELSAGGTTPGEAGLIQAYNLAKHQFIEHGNNRIILATDGDFNIGQKNEEDLELLISKMKTNGIYLTCLGVGMGNYKDSKIEIMARKGNGNFAYLDSEDEGEKVLVKEFTQNLYTAAENVTLTIQFDSTKLSGYRLIGYNNAKASFGSEIKKIEGGEIGYGQSVLAIYELQFKKEVTGEYAAIDLQYTEAVSGKAQRIAINCSAPLIAIDKAPMPYQFAASLSLFGMMLRHTEYVKDKKWVELLELSKRTADLNDPKQKEYVELVQKAQRIYVPSKRKKA